MFRFKYAITTFEKQEWIVRGYANKHCRGKLTTYGYLMTFKY